MKENKMKNSSRAFIPYSDSRPDTPPAGIPYWKRTLPSNPSVWDYMVRNWNAALSLVSR